jgi:hypothetical protein
MRTASPAHYVFVNGIIQRRYCQFYQTGIIFSCPHRFIT